MIETAPPTVNTDLLDQIYQAQELFKIADSPVLPTQLFRDDELSQRYNADIWFASELHQPIGAYKIRGAWNFMHHLGPAAHQAGLVTASAGNHAQGLALSANLRHIEATIFMPENTPEAKVERVRHFGGLVVNTVLTGQSFDECEQAAWEYQTRTGAVFAHPFNDERVIAGQGTLGLEIADLLPRVDQVMCPIGGGGLIAGLATALKAFHPERKVVGVEPEEAASMQCALESGQALPLKNQISTFVDGAAVRKVGEVPFRLASHLIEEGILTVSDKELRQTVTELWERPKPLKVELAGALSVCALSQLAEEFEGQTVVCVLSGGNLSQERYQGEIKLSSS